MTNTWQKWTEAEEAKLIELFKQGLTNKEICEQLNRNNISVAHRIALLKDTKQLEEKRRTRTSEQVYDSNALRIVENFKNKKLKTKHKIANSTIKLTNENHKLILKMDARNEADGLSLNSRSNYIIHARTFAFELGKKSLIDASLDDDILPHLTNLQKRLKETGYNPHRSTLKHFYNTLALEYSDNKELIKIATYFNQKKRGRKKTFEPEEKEHLTKAEVVKLISGIKGNDKVAIRNRAILACLYDTGARLSEFCVVRKRNCLIDGKVPRLYFPISKTKPRDSHMLNFSMPYLTEWLKVHEFWNDDNPPLFYSFSTSNYGELLAQQMVTIIVRRALRISKIGKNITPHSLRHSKAYHCAIGGMLPSEANTLFGWGRSSAMFTYYSKLSEKETRDRELERAGKLTPEELEERKLERNAFKLKKCARCETEATPDQFLCGKCGLALNKRVADQELKREKEKDGEILKLRNQMSLMQKDFGELKKTIVNEIAADLRKNLKASA